ncbi:hypothetical protein [Oceanobacillus sp. FSL H7-0719]|uniref:hypothetical protein n=1 Tax=Oceanobacillus sp. FSL H7-0719 TaxID=2954507 RepID=UPI003249DFD8
MLVSTMIFGWTGVILFLFLSFSYQKLAKSNEFALVHIVMAIMYATWLPLPFTLNHILKIEYLQIGTIFGIVYLLLLVSAMTLQAGHITFIVKENDNRGITDIQGEYMMFTLSNPLEATVNIFKCIWALFLALAFWNQNERIMAVIMLFFSFLIFYYLAIVLNTVMVKQMKLFSWVKQNIYFTNLETFSFFFVLLIYLTLVP